MIVICRECNGAMRYLKCFTQGFLVHSGILDNAKTFTCERNAQTFLTNAKVHGIRFNKRWRVINLRINHEDQSQADL